jgi:prepilin-type N-terminal cleavage/methylation domain-containing protein
MTRTTSGSDGKPAAARARGPSGDSRGFTLIELLVVVVLIALISLFAIPSISSYFQVSLNSAARDLATTIKEAYNSTVVTGRVYRVVYDLKEGKYWVESGPPTMLLDTAESREKEERKRRYSMSTDKPAANPFSLDRTITRDKIALPRGVTFEDVVTQQSPDPITEGAAYTHFFPHGLTEQTIIHLRDTSSHRHSLVISPVVGRTDLYQRYVTSKEIFDK